MPPRCASRAAPAREQGAALLEDAIGALVELALGVRDGEPAVDDALGHHTDLVGDALPFGHARRGLDALELVAKRARVDVVRERAPTPRAAPRRQVAGQRME